MPISPGEEEDQAAWMSRCVPEMMDSGREQDQAVAICLNMWRGKAASKPARNRAASERWSCGGSRELPIAETERSWDGSGAAKRMLDRANIGEEEGSDPAMARKGFLIYDAANPNLRGSYSCPFADVVDGTLKVIPSGLRAAASRLPQVTDVSQAVKDRARGILDVYFGRLEKEEEKMAKQQSQKQKQQDYGGYEIPSVEAGELENDYLGRCRAAVSDQGGDESEADSLCALAWENRSYKPKRKQDDEEEEEDYDVPEVDAGESEGDYIDRCVGDLVDQGAIPPEAGRLCALAWEGRSFTRMREKEIAKRLTKQDDEEEDYNVPEINEDESQDDYFDRCLASVTDQGADEDEAVGLCSMAWENRAFKRLRHKTHAELVNGMEFILSDETPDRMGDIISSAGWDLNNFKRNPIALFNHRSDFPIGIWENLRATRGALRGNLRLAPLGTSERIDEIRRLIEADILKAVSVGFRPINSHPRKVGEKTVGEYFVKQELVETSLVSVPANPNALAIAKSLDISSATIDLVFAKNGKQYKTTQFSGASKTGKHAGTKKYREESAMSLAQRISDTQARIVALRDKLTDHLSNVDDSNVSDTQLELTNDLNAHILQEQKQLAALVEAEKSLNGKNRDEDESPNLPAMRNGRTTNGNGDMRTREVAPYTYSRSPKSAIPPTREGRIELIVRAGIVQAFAHRHKISLEQSRVHLAGQYPRYGDDATRVYSAYAAKQNEAAPAMTTVDGWAAELVQLIHGDIMELLMPKSVFPSLSSLGLSLTFGRAGRISIPTRSRTPSIHGSFVGEGMPIPVRQGEFTAQILTPKKLAVITTWTREIDEASIPAIEGLLRNAIQEDTAVAIDSCLLDDDPADLIRPAGLLNGVTPITPSAATPGFNAMVADMRALSGALMSATLGNVRKMVWIMNPQQTLGAALTAMPGVSAFPFKDEIGTGKLLGYPIIESATVPIGVIIAMDASEFVTVGGEAPRFEISDQATLHMERDDPEPINDGTPANPVRSLWQTDTLALRLILPLNWCMRRPGCIAVVGTPTPPGPGVTW